MQVFILQDSNGEAPGIPSDPVVFAERGRADRAWARMVLDALDSFDNPEDELGYPLAEAFTLGTTVYLDGAGIELRSWSVEVS